VRVERRGEVGGISSASTASSALQVPSAFARATAARPGSAMRPAASSRAMRSLFAFDQFDPGLRGAIQSIERRSSFARGRLSTQPKARHSSTIAS
jgi:hypothetical protein